MKSKSELTDFYYKALYPALKVLEKDRVQLSHRVITIGIIYTIVIVLITSTVHTYLQQNNVFIFASFGYFVGGGIIYTYLIKDYTQEFKDKIISPLIHALDKNLQYSPDYHVGNHHFTHSKIFTSRLDKLDGNDYVKGKIDDVNIEFSDLHAQTKYKDTKGNTHYKTIFQGLFIVTDFNKHFKAQTVILPDTAQSTFGDYIGNLLQSHNMGRNELVKMDSVAFEKEFVVYSSDQIEARYILSHSLMEKLLLFKKHSNHPLSLSFVGGKVYLAIAYNKDLFEPSIFHSLLKYKIAMEYVGTLHLAVGIVEELKLNQKLWSKL